MKYRNVLYVVSMVSVLSSMVNGMHCSLTSKQLKIFTKSFMQKKPSALQAFFDLCKMVDNPSFQLDDTQEIIEKGLAKDDGYRYPSQRNMLIEHIVFKSTENKLYDEEKYSSVLKQLRERLGSKGQYGPHTMLHSAVISDLPLVTEELLNHDKGLVAVTDFNKCIPLHYAQSAQIAQMLLDNGSQVDARDKDGNTPLHVVPARVADVLMCANANIHAESDMYLRVPGDYCGGWHRITPLRKAVDEGDFYKVASLLSYMNVINKKEIDEDEMKILQSLASLRFWRTKDPVFKLIKNIIE